MAVWKVPSLFSQETEMLFFYKISLRAKIQSFRPNFYETRPADIIEFDCFPAHKQTKLSKAALNGSKF